MYKFSYANDCSYANDTHTNIKRKTPTAAINLDNYNIFTNHQLDHSLLVENINHTLSESPNFPEFPNGNSPPNIDYIRLIYLNYLANNSLTSK